MDSIYVIGALVAGFIVGLIPLITGIVNKKFGLGIGGFFACLFGGLILGMLLSIPLCVLFMFLILKKPQQNGNYAPGYGQNPTPPNGYPGGQPYPQNPGQPYPYPYPNPNGQSYPPNLTQPYPNVGGAFPTGQFEPPYPAPPYSYPTPANDAFSQGQSWSPTPPSSPFPETNPESNFQQPLATDFFFAPAPPEVVHSAAPSPIEAVAPPKTDPILDVSGVEPILDLPEIEPITNLPEGEPLLDLSGYVGTSMDDLTNSSTEPKA